MHVDEHLYERLLTHAAVGAPAAILVSDRLVAVTFSVCASLFVGVVMELARPWLARRARRIAGESDPPPATSSAEPEEPREIPDVGSDEPGGP